MRYYTSFMSLSSKIFKIRPNKVSWNRNMDVDVVNLAAYMVNVVPNKVSHVERSLRGSNLVPHMGNVVPTWYL